MHRQVGAAATAYDVIWLSSDCTEWRSLANELDGMGLRTSCRALNTPVVHARLVILDALAFQQHNYSSAQSGVSLKKHINAACTLWGGHKVGGIRTGARVYYREPNGASSHARLHEQLPRTGCDGIIHQSEKIARSLRSKQESAKQQVRGVLQTHHVFLASHLASITAEQVHALMPPNLYKPHTWAKSGACRGNEPLQCADPLTKLSPKLNVTTDKKCYTFNTPKELASTRTVHISASVRDACNKKLESCPFPNSTWANVGQGVGSVLMPKTMKPRHKTCALVGSSPSARGYATDIDQHEAVIRFNDAPTEPHHGVGTKTTYRLVLCFSASTLCRPGAEHDPRWPGRHIWKGFYNKNIGEGRSFWALFHRTPLCANGSPHCSTGGWGIAFALTVCDQIDVYGYGPVSVDNVVRYARYYGEPVNSSSWNSNGGHSYVAEMAKLHALHCGGFINVHGPLNI